MSNLAKLRVHIVPLGFEIDRIILPAQQMKADKIWLLRHDNPAQDKAKSYSDKIIKEFKKNKIKVEFAEANRNDVFNILKIVKEIFEKEKNNDIYVNVSSGSKIQAIACMMACMMFNDDKNVNPFYVEAKEYLGFSGKPISKGIKEIEYVPTYEIQTPEERHIAALKIVVDKGGRISKKEMAKLAVEKKLIVVNAENQSQATFASLDKNIISVLENQWGFVTVEKIGRTRWIQITEEGKHAAEFLI